MTFILSLVLVICLISLVVLDFRINKIRSEVRDNTKLIKALLVSGKIKEGS